jgi:hypothetical protein
LWSTRSAQIAPALNTNNHPDPHRPLQVSLDRGLEHFQIGPDFLNFTPDQFDVFGRQVRSAVSIRTLQIANASQKTR